MTSICIDGFNLARPEGSGIATYGRNLLINARAIGFETEALYGPTSGRSSDNLVNETALADPGNRHRSMSRLERYGRTLTSRFGRNAHAIQPTDDVIWSDRTGGRPHADRFWAAQDLFVLANRAFKTYRSETPVRFEPGFDAPAPDVMHWTAPLPLHARDIPNVYTLHDLIPLRLPHAIGNDKALFLSLCQTVARRADHIAVVSETTRRDVIRLLNLPEDRVTTTYQSVDLPQRWTARPQPEVALELEGVFGLGWKEYFLHFGAIEPKKNLGRIVEAYLASGSQTPLVIVGSKGWSEGDETALLDQVQRDGGTGADRIRRYEHLPQSLLISLIRGAKATLFPSLYEGFGLPVLESMLLGTAVLTSTAGSLPEVAGEAAISVDPYDVQAMTRGLQALDADEGLRHALVDRGRIQAAMFSPEAYQDRLRLLYAAIGIR